MNHHYAIIMAGGVGTRFWPMSTTQHPKQFLDILGISDVVICIEKLKEISKKIEDVINNKNNTEILINNLQNINNELSSLLKNYGTENLEDLLLICFGNNSKLFSDNIVNEKFELLKKYFHPISYKVLCKKDETKLEKNINETINNFTCYDISSSYKQFHMKVYGLKLYIHSSILNKSLIVFGVIDDVIIDLLNSEYIKEKKLEITQNLPSDSIFHNETFDKFISSLDLKDFLINENTNEIYSKFSGYITQNNLLKQKQISQTVKDFISDDIFNKRNTLINLLVCSSNYENQYLAYLLYDLLSNDSNGSIDTQEQTILFDSFPWNIKQCFKQAMKKTIQYTNDLSNFDINKIPLEQQICLLKASDTVKEKAMMKLKEVKAKSEDSGSKARQYIDGLLKIPFGVYKREPILNMMDKIRINFKELYKKHEVEKNFTDIPKGHPLYVKGMISHVYRRLHRKKPSTTIIAGGGGGTWGYHFSEPRPLTNRERARLFCYPDDFIFSGTISQVSKQIGNSVPPLAARHLGLSLIGAFKAKSNLRKLSDKKSRTSVTGEYKQELKYRAI
jgi:hypothetical protein